MTDAKIVLVTGASSGIGRACARLLQERGHVVFGTSRKPAAAAAWRMLQLDVCDDSSVARAVSDIIAAHGRLDVVINNAGLVMAGALEDSSLDDARRQFDTNVFGVLRVCKAVLPHMRAQRAGLIVNIGSLAGVVGLPFQGLYSASKFAIEGLTEALRLEVGAFGVRAIVVEPGDIATGVVENRVRVAGSGEGSPYRATFETVVATFEKEERAGADPMVVARAIAGLVEGGEPPVRRAVGPLSQRLLSGLKPFLPSRWFEFGLRVYYGLKRG